MTLTDPIGDMFSRIRNGQMRSLNSVEIPSSNFRKNILKILKDEGYIKDFFIAPLGIGISVYPHFILSVIQTKPPKGVLNFLRKSCKKI